MNVLKCSNCGMPLNPSEFTAGMNMACRHCGHKGIPVSSVLYDKAKMDTEGEDVFKTELSPESIFSKFTVASFVGFLLSFSVQGLQELTVVLLVAFLMFFGFYGFFRIQDSS